MALPVPEFIQFGREVCGDLRQAERREWWLANGLGAYAAGTIAGTLTRRYHGLLIAPVNPPLGRYLVLAKAEATLLDGDREWPLATNRWRDGALDPQGYLHIESFRLEGRMPVWTYAFGEIRLEMRVWMEPGANTTYVAYRLQRACSDARRSPQLRIRLLINARDHHGTTQPWNFNPIIEHDVEHLRVVHPNWFELHFKCRTGTFRSDHAWIENFSLPVERERGLPDVDNHLCVGEVLLNLPPGQWSGVVASLDEDASPYVVEAMRRFRAHDAGVLALSGMVNPELYNAPAWVHQLVLAADSFVFKRPLPNTPEGESVIAGYPWFGDWGRDTMIALPGLTIATGRYESARLILETFARFIDQGMLPNVFPGDGALPEYNTVDAALWYIEAWRAFINATSDELALKRVFPVLQDIVEWHCKGARYGIGVDPADGLLRAGEPGVQLTWMDAKLGDWVVTPRVGKPVEVNALWFNALKVMAGFASQLKRRPKRYELLAERARQGFARFIRPDGLGLYDVLDSPMGDDETIRPNQIFAVSLSHSPLDTDAQRRVVEQCGRELLCSYGLRSLAAEHPEYRPEYRGGVWERDSAYHQGPVWGWLLGHYALAEYRVSGDAQLAQSRLEPMRDHLLDAGLGTASEIFDGAPPHAPRGAPSQAWSVACVLEAWWRLELAKRAARFPQSTVSAA